MERFCKEYFSVYGKEEKLQGVTKKIYRLMWFLFVVGILELIWQMEDGLSVWDVHYSIFAPCLFGVADGVVFLLIDRLMIQPIVLKMKWGWRWLRVRLIVMVVIAVAAGYFSSLNSLHIYERIVIPVLPVIFLSGGYILVCTIIDRLKCYQWTIKRPEDAIKEAEKEERTKQYMQACLAGYKIRYQKINDKRFLKGKNEMTPEEFTEQIRTEINFFGIFRIVIYIVMALIFGGNMISTYINNMDVLTTTDMIWYGIMMLGGYLLTVCIVRCLLLLKVRKRILEECDFHNVDILSYGEWEANFV